MARVNFSASAIARSRTSTAALEVLREQTAHSLRALTSEERASEILVGFSPQSSAPEQARVPAEEQASVEHRMRTAKATQQVIEERAVDLMGGLRPAKKELGLPGLTNVEQDISQLQENVVDSSWLTGTVRVTATPSMIRRLARRKDVAFIVPNQTTALPTPVEVHQSEIQAVLEHEQQTGVSWGIELLQIPRIWADGITGSGVLIGHLDTGIEASHPDLMGKVEEFALFGPRGEQVASDAFDSHEHGTHTAGTIVGGRNGGVAIGVAPEARLVSALVLMGGKGTIWQIIKGMEWAVSRGVRVLSMSLGDSGYAPVYEYALGKVASLGVFVACSIGNGGLAVTASPGNQSQVCGVGAIDIQKQVADFSGGGSVSWFDALGRLVEIHKPDVVAPGVAVFSSIPERKWGYSNGTSMAAPHVAGIAALLTQANPSASLGQILDALYSTAKRPDTAIGRDSRYGRGIVDPVRALEHIQT